MKLFIIGNGFDIGHRLKTKYWDFRDYLDRCYPDFLKSFEEHYNIYPGMSNDEKQSLLWNRFETNLANIDEDSIIDIGTSIEMDLDSGDVGIEDTLYHYFSDEYKYIQLLAVYLKRWVRSIRIRDVLPRTSLIDNSNGDLFLTFNYTAVLENVYKISAGQIIHIHGSLREYTDDPIIGHGNQHCIDRMRDKITAAQNLFDEKETSICRVVEDYYKHTLKETNKYIYKLSRIGNEPVAEIVVIGHSLEGIDMPYFAEIDKMTGQDTVWLVYCYSESEREIKRNSLIKAGIGPSRIVLRDSSEFYDLDDAAAERRAFEIKYGF